MFTPCFLNVGFLITLHGSLRDTLGDALHVIKKLKNPQMMTGLRPKFMLSRRYHLASAFGTGLQIPLPNPVR